MTERFTLTGVWQDNTNQSHGRCYKVYDNFLKKVVFVDNPVCFGEYNEEFVAIKNEKVYRIINGSLQPSNIKSSKVSKLSESQFEAKLDFYNKRSQRRDFIANVDRLAGVESLKFINDWEYRNSNSDVVQA